MPQSLAVEYSNKGGNTQVQVYRNNNGTLIAVGNPYTPASLPADAQGSAKHNLAVQFGEYFYCSAGNEIRRYNPSTSNWDVEVLAYATASINSSSLLVGTGPTGTPRLAIVYRFGATVAVRTLDIPGGTWSAAINTGLLAGGLSWPHGGQMVFNNEYLINDGNQAISWNFDGSGSTRQTVGVTPIPVVYSFTRVGTRLFAINWTSSTALIYVTLWERVGGTWVSVLDGSINQVAARWGSNGGQSPTGTMVYDKASDSLVVIHWLQANTAALFEPGTGLKNGNPGGSGLHAVRIPISGIGKIGVQIGPDAVGTGFAFTATTITRNDGGSWITDGFEVASGSFIRVAGAEDAGNVGSWGPVTGATANVLTIASASFVTNADDTTANFFLKEQNLTGLIAPGAIAAPGAPDPLSDLRSAWEVDTETDPFNPLSYLWISVNNGAWARYQFNGISTPMTVLGTGGDRGIALSHNPQGGGEYFYGGSTTIAPAYHVEEAAAPVPLNNASRIFLRGKIIDETGGAPTPTDEQVGIYFNKLKGPTADVLGTILNVAKVSGPGNAPTLNANKITMTFDNVSIYSVEWQAVTDGLVDQEQHLMMPRAEV